MCYHFIYMNTDTQVVILAAGKGTRMGGDIPKALTKLNAIPMINYVVDTSSSFSKNQPIVVVGYKGEMIEKHLDDTCLYVEQKEQKGTGHALMATKKLLEESNADTVIVLYADQPYISKKTLEILTDTKHSSDTKIVIATTVIEDDELFENQFYNFGRIIRDNNGVITKIVEKKDATKAELLVREVNPAYFCLDKKWALRSLARVNNDNAQGEYYLTDLVQMAFDEGLIIKSVQIDAKEALGANTREQLAVLESFLNK